MKTIRVCLVLTPAWFASLQACGDGADPTPQAFGGQAGHSGQGGLSHGGNPVSRGGASGGAAHSSGGRAPQGGDSTEPGASPASGGTLTGDAGADASNMGGASHISGANNSGANNSGANNSGADGGRANNGAADGGARDNEGGASSVAAAAGSGSPSAGAGAAPMDPDGVSANARAIVVGRAHSCAVTADGAVRCWGSSERGQIGNGVQDASAAGVFTSPVQVEGLTSGVTHISSFEDHTCVVVAGAVKCWGANEQGQLGDGSRNDSAVPVAVSGLSAGVKAVAVGARHSCALTRDAAVRCWGNNERGQLGDASGVEYSATPVQVSGLSSSVAGISAGSAHVCVVTASGTARCWGSNQHGELGIGASGNAAATPKDVSSIPAKISSVVAGHHVSCAITNGGALWCWGKNVNGQVGNGKAGIQEQEVSPVLVSGLGAGVIAASSGDSFTCAVVSGAAQCWGSNFYLVLGNDQDSSYESAIPVPVTGLGMGVVSVAATASDHACALSHSGAVKCWGSGGSALGHGTSDAAPTPVDVIGFP